MSTEEYRHKLKIRAIPGFEKLPEDMSEEAYSAIEDVVKRSGFDRRYLIIFSKDPPDDGFVLHLDRLPKRREMNRLSGLNLGQPYQ